MDVQNLQPLSNIVVLELATGVLGPFAGAILGDLGAEVIKIEATNSEDPYRHSAMLAGFMPGLLPNNVNALFEGYNRNKKGIAIDLKTEEGKSVLYRHVEHSDVFLTCYRLTVLEKLGVDYKTLSSINPKLIYARGSGYGTRGSDRDQVAWDGSAQARSGFMYAANTEDPRFVSIGIADQTAGILLAAGVLAAIVARERYGTGQEVDSSLFGAAIALQMEVLLWLMTRQLWPRSSRDKPANPTWNTYKCADGKWLVLTMGTYSDIYWPPFCKAVGLEELARDAKFSSVERRQKYAKELVEILDKTFSSKTRDEWIHILKQSDVSWAPVKEISDLEYDPQALENRYIVEWRHPDLGPIKLPGFLFDLRKTPASIRMRAPQWGEHTDQVLKTLGGYSEAEIIDMKRRGIVR